MVVRASIPQNVCLFQRLNPCLPLSDAPCKAIDLAKHPYNFHRKKVFDIHQWSPVEFTMTIVLSLPNAWQRHSLPLISKIAIKSHSFQAMCQTILITIYLQYYFYFWRSTRIQQSVHYIQIPTLRRAKILCSKRTNQSQRSEGGRWANKRFENLTAVWSCTVFFIYSYQA